MNHRTVKFGISSWTFPWAVGVVNGPHPPSRLSAMGLLEKAIKLNVKLLQIADNLPLESLPQSELKELNSVAIKRKISLEVGTKGIDFDHLIRFLEVARFLKSPIVRTLPGSFVNKINLEDVELNLRRVLPAFEKAGIILVLENTEAFSVQEYFGLMEGINHPNLRMCIDLANALGKMEGPYYFMEKIAPYCGNYHYKDIDIVRSPNLMGFTIIGKPSGQGIIPIKWVMDELLKYNLNPSIIIELWPAFQGTIEETVRIEDDWAKKSVDFMRGLNW